MSLRLGVLGSGEGTNLQAFLDALAERRLVGAEIAVVLSDNGEAPILHRARAAGIPAQHVDPGPFRSKLDAEAEERYITALQEHRVDMVILAGFMRIVKDRLLQAFALRMLNVHPSLLPAFPGLRAWVQALDAGVKVTGCTVHVVTAGVDAGPILGQTAVEVMHDDTADSLYARIQAAEHRLYPSVVQAFVDGRVRVDGGRARVTPRSAAAVFDG